MTFAVRHLRTVSICGTWALKFGARSVVIKKRNKRKTALTQEIKGYTLEEGCCDALCVTRNLADLSS